MKLLQLILELQKIATELGPDAVEAIAVGRYEDSINSVDYSILPGGSTLVHIE